MKFKTMALKTKILLGNCLPLVLLTALAVLATLSVNSLLDSSNWVDHTHKVLKEAMKIEAAAVDMETGMRGFLLAGKEEFLDPYKAGQERFSDLTGALKKTVDDNPAQVKLLGEIEGNINEWQKEVVTPMIDLRRRIGDAETMNDMARIIRKAEGKKYFDAFREQIKTFIDREQVLLAERREAAKAAGENEAGDQLLTDAAKWVEHTHAVIARANEILTAALDMETGARGFLLAGEETFLEPFKEGRKKFDGLIASLSKTVDDNPAQVKLLGEIKATIDRWRENVVNPQIVLREKIGDARTMDDMADLVGEARGKSYFDKFRGQVKTFMEREQVLMVSRREAAENTANFTRNILFFGTFATVLIALVIAYFMGRAIVNPINRIIEGLNEGAERVASSSGQMASASQQLSEGSSEQAAALEETSSSLEEMASITKQNAENATQADGLMREANQTVGEADRSMNGLIGSMGEISKASEETQKIVKTIDEIAFQTNLLALNAAVEAARAGEAGAGFAVVADEVRNLAMRAADAARNTADLIEGTVKRVGEGSELVTMTNGAFGRVSENSTRVGELVAEIAAASNEQAQGIDQVNRAMSEMDGVTQQNASNAEESAGASEEMYTQADQMKGMVDDLVTLVGGNGNGAVAGRVSIGSVHKSSIADIHAAPLQRLGSKTTPVHHGVGAPGPEELLPLDSDALEKF